MRTSVFLAACVLSAVDARCPNDCSGKGVCNTASVCECYANYIGNDCSQRLCNFGKSFVDTPVGDINANGLTDTDQQVFLGYTNGLVGEQYDVNYGVARTVNSDEWDEAHFYRECSNKGVCNRKTGACDCYPGFEGEGCRRASCPLDCNGHGMCVLLEDESSTYEAWDHDKTQRCHCDPGYSGPDCSQRECPSGADPVQYPYSDINVVYKLDWAPQSGNIDNGLPNGPTLFTLTYTDNYGDEWTTPAITMHYQADCSDPADDGEASLSDNIFDPQTLPNSFCTSVPFVANPYLPNTNEIGSVIHSKFLDKFFAFDEGATFLYDDDFIGEQVNNTLKNLPNDVLRNPYVWTAYNPVQRFGSDPSTLVNHPHAHGFLYPSVGTLDYEAATGGANGADSAIGDGSDPANGWSICQSTPDSDYCYPAFDFSDGPSKAVDDPRYRFPFFADNNKKHTQNGALGNIDKAAEDYLNCELYHVCIFIKIPGALATRSLTMNYHYKPRLLVLVNSTSDIPDDSEEGQFKKMSWYDVIYGQERRGHVSTAGTSTGSFLPTGSDLVTLTSVGADRVWLGRDGTPTINFPEQASIGVHVCSKRGLCNYDTGKCECFFGYTSQACDVRTPSQIQS